MRHPLPFALAIILVGLGVTTPVLAQEPTWKLRVGAGGLFGTGTTASLDSTTRVDLRRKTFVGSVDVIRQVETFNLEVFLSAFLPIVPVTLSTPTNSQSAGHIVPTGVQAGINYRLHEFDDTGTRARQWFYLSAGLGGFSKDRSGAVRLTPDRETAFRFPGGWGLALGGGWRYRLNEQFALDGQAKWQISRMSIGESGRMSWSPIVLTGGIVLTLY